MSSHPHHARNGLWLALGAYVYGGFLPLYYVPAQELPAFEMLAQRIVWTIVALLPLCFAQVLWPEVRAALRHPRTVLILAATAFCLGTTWVIFMWAMTNGQVLHASLGYFISPLIFVLLGVVFLGERLRPVQTASVTLAAAGVAVMVYRTGSLPWVALGLATLFAFYGLLRRRLLVHTFSALFLEALFLAPFAIVYSIYLAYRGESTFTGMGAGITAWYILLGPVTMMPLLMFGAAAKRISLASMGIWQYISPIIGFFLGVFYFHEPFERTQLITFGLIWASLVVFLIDELASPRAAAPLVVDVEP